MGSDSDCVDGSCGMTDGPCPVCDGQPRVLVVMRHPTMLRFTRELLDREFRCWLATELGVGQQLADTLDRMTPDLMIIDAADFPSCCLAALARIPRQRVIVIGPEPDPSYRAAALANGAGAWISRDRVGEELAQEMRTILGCIHDPCPPAHRPPRPRSSMSRDDAARNTAPSRAPSTAG